jgi:hypothetical protein
MVIWPNILFSINMVIKKLQSMTMCMDAKLEQIKGIISCFKKYRDEGLCRNINIAKEIAKDIDVEPVFPRNRKAKRKKHFDEQNDQNVEEALLAIESFGVNYFLVVGSRTLARGRGVNRRF